MAERVSAGSRGSFGESNWRRSKSLVMAACEKYVETLADDKPCGEDAWVEDRMSVLSKLL